MLPSKGHLYNFPLLNVPKNKFLGLTSVTASSFKVQLKSPRCVLIYTNTHQWVHKIYHSNWRQCVVKNSKYIVLKSYYFIQWNKTWDNVNDNLILKIKFMFMHEYMTSVICHSWSTVAMSEYRSPRWSHSGSLHPVLRRQWRQCTFKSMTLSELGNGYVCAWSEHTKYGT